MVGGIWGTATPAQGYTLDFEDPTIQVGNGNKGSKVIDANGNYVKDQNGNQVWSGDGDLISDQWVEAGVSIYEASGKNLLLFNSNCNGGGSNQFSQPCTGWDGDLATGDHFGTEPQGNVLIIQEHNRLYDPDDDASGGTIFFDYTDLVDLTQIFLLDVDNGNPGLAGISFEAYFSDGSSQTYLTSDLSYTNLANKTGDNSLYQFDLSQLDAVEKFGVNYTSTGAVASISWEDNHTQDIPEPAAGLGILAAGLIGLIRSRRF